MPSTYAHYFFGEKVAASLSGPLYETVAKNKQLFYIGLHGPDILFYYKPLENNRVNALGYGMHERPAAEFFKRARDILQTTENKDGARAYLAGFVCHFALDSACHGYIEKKIEVSGLAHAEIENEFDRFLIYYSGKDLRNVNLTAHIQATDGNAQVIAPFFENISPEQVKKSLRSIKFYNNLLVGNRAYKRFIVTFCLKISGMYEKMKGAAIYKKPLEGCSDSNKRLFKLFKKAENDCIGLESSLSAFLDGDNSLDEKFNSTFGAGDNWKDIPVLNEAEEDMYEV